MANNDLAASDTAKEMARVAGLDDLYWTPEGNIVTVEDALTRRNTLAETDTLRFSPFVLRRQDILAEDAKERVLAKAKAARAGTNEWVDFTNAELPQGVQRPVSAQTIDAILAPIEKDPDGFVVRMREFLQSHALQTAPVEESALEGFRQALPNPETAISAALRRLHVPYVLGKAPAGVSTKASKAMIIFNPMSSFDKGEVRESVAQEGYRALKEDPDLAAIVSDHRGKVGKIAREKLRGKRIPGGSGDVMDGVFLSTGGYIEPLPPEAQDPGREFYREFMAAVAKKGMRTKALEKVQTIEVDARGLDRNKVPLRIVNLEDDVYIPLEGKLMLAQQAHQATLTDQKIQFTPLIFGPPDFKDTEKTRSKIDAAEANIDSFARYISQHVPGMSEDMARGRLRSAISTARKEMLSRTLEDGKGSFLAICQDVLRDRKTKPGTISISEDELNAFERALKSDRKLMPDYLLSAFSRQHVLFMAGHPKGVLRLSPGDAIYGADSARNSAIARFDIASLPKHPEALSEFIMSTTLGCLTPEKPRTLLKRAITPGTDLMREINGPGARFVKGEHYNIDGSRRVIRSGESLLQAMHYWLNDPRSGLNADEVRKEMPLSAMTYDAFMEAQKKEEIQKGAGTWTEVEDAARGVLRLVEDRNQIPLRLVGTDDLGITYNGKAATVTEMGKLAAGSSDQLKFAPLIIRPSDARDMNKVRAKVARAEADIPAFAGFIASQLPDTTPQAARERLAKSLTDFKGSLDRAMQPSADGEASNLIFQANGWPLVIPGSRVSDEQMREFEEALKSHTELLPTPIMRALSNAQVNFVVTPALEPSDNKANYYIKPESNMALATFDIATQERHPEALSDYIMHTAYKTLMTGMLTRAVADYTGSDADKMGNGELVKSLRPLTDEFFRQAPAFIARENYNGGERRTLGESTSPEDILCAMHYWLNDPKSGINPQEVRQIMPESLRFYEASMRIMAERSKPSPAASAPALPPGNPPPPPRQHTYHVLPEGQELPVVKGVGDAARVQANLPLLITPEAVEDAEAGKFHFLTLSEARRNIDALGSGFSLSHILASINATHLTQESFIKRVEEARDFMRQNGTVYKLKNGDKLDTNHYFDEIEAHAAEWVKQAEVQVKERDGRLTRQYGAQGVAQKNAEFDEANNEFRQLYAAFDAPAKALIQRAGVQFYIDNTAEFSGTKDLLMNVKQNFIVATPTFLKNKYAGYILRDRAVNCALLNCALHGNAQGIKSLHELSEREMKGAKNLPSKWTEGGDANDMTWVMAASRQEAEKRRELLPITYIADHQSELFVRNEAYAILQGAPAPEITASPTAFTVDATALTLPQQEYFNELNAIMAKLSVTPQEFDNQFKMAILQLNTAVDTSVQGKFGGIKTPALDLITEAPRNLPVEFRGNYKLPGTQSERHAILTSLGDDMVGPKRDFQTVCFGGTDSGSVPIKILPHEEAILEFYKDKKGDPNEYPASASENMLQKYAGGEIPLPLLKHGKFDDITRNGLTAVYPSFDQFFQTAVANSMLYLCDKKGIDREALQADLGKLDEIAKRAFLWPDELARADQEERKAGHAEWTALDKEFVEAQHKKGRLEMQPEPYVIATVAQGGERLPLGRISDISGRIRFAGWERGADASRVMGMCHLHNEIEELRETIDSKVPELRELGDLLFSKSNLRRAEYTCLPLSEDAKLPKYMLPDGKEDKDFRKRAMAAIQAVYDKKPEEISEHQRWRYEALKRIIEDGRSPVILAAVGSDGDLIAERNGNASLFHPRSPDDVQAWQAAEVARRLCLSPERKTVR